MNAPGKPPTTLAEIEAGFREGQARLDRYNEAQRLYRLADAGDPAALAEVRRRDLAPESGGR